MRIRTIMASTAVFAFMTSASFAQNVTTDTVLATVGDTDITVAHLIEIKQKLPQEYQSLPDQILFDGLLEQVIQQTLLMDAANTAPTWLDTSLENERRNLMAAAVIMDVTNKAVTDDAVAAAYSAKYETGTGQQEYNASHILVETEEKALALIAELDAGADFAALAAENSTGPSGPNGGELGWFGLGQMVPEFETAVVSMKKGAVSTPVQTQFGWHIVKLNDTREMMPPTLDSVREQIEMDLQATAVETYIATLTEAESITRNTDDVDATFLSTLTVQDIK